jgi:prevent-host-death family protein
MAIVWVIVSEEIGEVMNHPKLSEDLRPMSALKSQGAEIVRHVTETRRPVVLTKHGRGVAVVVSLEAYEELQEAAELAALRAAIAEGMRDVEAGRVVGHEEAKQRLRQWAEGE